MEIQERNRTAASEARKIKSSIIEKNGERVPLKVGDVTYIAHRAGTSNEYYLTDPNGNNIKLAEDGTLCRKDGRCLSGCGYCL